MVDSIYPLTAMELMVLIKFKMKCLDYSRSDGSRSQINRINELITYLEDLRHAIENNNNEVNYFTNK